jgi:hypothetical protein
MNGLIREHLPKGVNLAQFSQSYLNAIAHQLNSHGGCPAPNDEKPFNHGEHGGHGEKPSVCFSPCPPGVSVFPESLLRDDVQDHQKFVPGIFHAV